MSKTMLAAVLHGIKDLRVEERPVPELAPGKVLLRIRRAGICGTDCPGHCGNSRTGRTGRRDSPPPAGRPSAG